MPHLIAISGSLRNGSYNTALLRAGATLVPAGTTVEIVPLNDIPLYNGDEESAHGLPPAVAALKEKIAASGGLIIATPEYNSGPPGVLKNALDWLSRPGKDIGRVFGNKPLGLMGAAAGASGTRLAQAALLTTVRAFQMRPYFAKSLYVAEAHKVFDEHGSISDEKVQKLLAEFMAGFAAFAAA